MSINSETLQIANIEIDVFRKDIKNMYLAVYPPFGKIRLSIPKNTNEEVIRLFLIDKLGWIKKQVKNFKSQSRETRRNYISGESHFFRGKRYMLEIIETDKFSKVSLVGTKKIIMEVPKKTSRDYRFSLMEEWYRNEMRNIIPTILRKWEIIIGVNAKSYGIRKMKTKWGSCNVDSAKLWFNLELIKKPSICMEYIIVHELIHLIEKKHNNQFIKLMDKYMPNWRVYEFELNNLPISFYE